MNDRDQFHFRRAAFSSQFKHRFGLALVVYNESMKRELMTRPIYECLCDERLKTKGEESTRLGYTGLLGKVEHLKIETRLIDEMFPSVMGEDVIKVGDLKVGRGLLK